MIDYNKELVSALGAVLPTHYEMALTSETQTPCISYMEINNYSVSEVVGATLGYSRITYQVKVWGHKIADLQKYAKDIDNVLRPLGFKRISSGELYDNNSTMIQKILTYEALALEEYN
jgi:hypothetical protein